MAWNLLLSSNSGLFSVFVIVFTLGMAVWFGRYFIRKIDEDEKKAAATEIDSTRRSR